MSRSIRRWIGKRLSAGQAFISSIVSFRCFRTNCEMEIDSTGQVVNHDVFPSVIRSNARMTYQDVNKILVDKDRRLREKYASLVPMFEDMEKLAAILRSKRMGRGAIDFDFKEAE